MPTTWQLECLHARFKSLETEIDRVKSKYHPYSEPDTIYRALLSVLRERRGFLDESYRLFADDKPHIFHGIYENLVRDVQAIFTTLSFADRVDSSRIPFELLRALSWAAADLLKEECKTVVRLYTDYNYAIVSCRQWFAEHSWEPHWNKTTGRSGRSSHSTVLVLEFPSPDVGSTLLHAIAAHELGHVVLTRFSDRFSSIHSILLEQATHIYKDLLIEIITDNMRKLPGVKQADAYEESSKRVEAALLRISYNWLTEVWADLMAARLVGPAGLAAFDRVALEPSEPNSTHPPGHLRRRIIKQYLDESFPHVAADPTWSSVLTPWPTSTASRTVRLPEAPLFPVMESLCAESIGLLSPLLSEIPSPLSTDVDAVVESMEDYIEHLCPPNPTLPSSLADSPAAVWSIIYGVWHFRFNKTRFEKFRRSLNADVSAAEGVLGNLLLHALHSAELTARWRTTLDAPLTD